MKVCVRVDATSVTGTGHFTRCLCLADELHAGGAEVQFAVAALPPHQRAQLQARGFTCLDLPAPRHWPTTTEAAWDHEAQLADATQLAALLQAAGCDLAIVDHYGLGVAWERQLRASVPALLVIDDLAREHDCSMLLDQNWHAHPAARYQGRVPGHCQLLLGPGFALLRPEFRELRAGLQPRSGAVRRALVFMGGSDAGNATGQVLAALAALPGRDFAVDVVIGADHPATADVRAACARLPQVTLHVQVPHMAQLLAAADLAVGAGGTATWERCALGVPTLALSLAENQSTLLQGLAAAGLAHAPAIAPGDTPALTAQLRALLDNPALRAHLSRAGMALVDGLGASRVQAALAAGGVRLRRATPEDSLNLHAWRNAEAVRAASHGSATIGLEEHQRWLQSVLAANDRHLLIGEQAGAPLGVVRFDTAGRSATISIYLAPAQHGRSLGLALLLAAEAWLRRELPAVTEIVAEVRAHNARSLRLFERCGYQPAAVTFTKRLAA